MKFNWLAAAFSGFGLIVRRAPTVLLWLVAWAAGVILMSIVGGVAGFVIGGPTNGGPIAGVVIALAVVVMSTLVVAAVQRVTLRPKDIDYAAIRFGKAELWTLAALAIPIGAQVLFSVGNVFLVKALQLRPPWNQLEGYAVNLVAVMLTSPFSLIVPAVFDRGKAGWRIGWDLGRGNRLRLLGMALIVTAIYFALSFGAARLITRVLPTDPTQGLGVLYALYAGFFVVGFLMIIVAVSPAAAAYRELMGDTNRVEDVFD